MHISLLLGCDWQLVWTHSVLLLNRQGALWWVCLTTRSVTNPVFLSEAGHCQEPCPLTACFGETGGCTRGALVYSRLITPALSITVWTQNTICGSFHKHRLSIQSAGSKNLSCLKDAVMKVLMAHWKRSLSARGQWTLQLLFGSWGHQC